MKYLLENIQQKRYGKFGTGTAGTLSILRDLPETII